MSAFEKINKVSHYTPSEQIFVDFVLAHPDEAVNMSAKSIAKNCFISLTTIYNALAKMKIQGIEQLKFELLKDLNEGFYRNIKQEKTDVSDEGHLTPIYNKVIQKTIALLDISQLRDTAEQMKRAGNIYFFSLTDNDLAIENFAENMALVSWPIKKIRLTDKQRAASLREGDLAMIVTYDLHNDFPWIRECLRQLSMAKTEVCLLCPMEDGEMPLPEVNRLHFYKYAHEKRKLSHFFTQLSLQYLLDFLFVTCQSVTSNHYQYQ